MLIITMFGETIFYVIFLLFLILIFNKKRKLFYPLIFTTSLSGVITTILKKTIMRARPIGEFVNNLIFNYNFPKSFSFPSGHAQTSFVFYTLFTIILLDNFYTGKNRKLYISLSILFSLVIAFSRLVLGVHFFSDILGGIIIALILITNYLYFQKNKLYFNN